MAVSKSRDQRSMEQLDKIYDMKAQQAAGSLPMVKANRNPKYEIRADEADGYVFLVTRVFHPEPNSFTNNVIEVVHAVHKDQLDQKIRQNAYQLYNEVEIIHDPRPNAPRSYEMKTLANATPAKAAESAGRRQPDESAKRLAAREKDLAAREAALDAREAELNAKKD